MDRDSNTLVQHENDVDKLVFMRLLLQLLSLCTASYSKYLDGKSRNKFLSMMKMPLFGDGCI